MATGGSRADDAGEATKKRLNIILPANSWARIERIMRLMEAETITEVTKDAFRLLEYVLDVTESGGKIFIEDKSGAKRQIEFF